ncbi:MAG TPA: FkbM family methyltransferase, partial [Terriglobales bacterium]|nr:FkbM family methyltransferase [Terriglobales bacterium]
MPSLRLFPYRQLIAIEKLVSSLSWGRKLKQLPWARAVYAALYKTFRPAGPLQAEVRGLRVHLDPADTLITRCLLVYGGVWEPLETEIFVSLVQPGMVVIDVGAHIGYYTLLAARSVGQEGRVFAFEPAPASYGLLCRNLESNGCDQVVAVRKAVAAHSGVARLWLSPESSALNKLLASDGGNAWVEVGTTSLDDYFADYTGRLDVIKIDTEGAEQLILDGMQRLLRRHRDLAIFTEFFPNALQSCGSPPKQYLHDLEQLGFHLFHLHEERHALRPFAME